MKKQFIYLLLSGLAMVSCRTGEVSVDGYKTWMGKKDNGLYKQVELDGFTIESMYKPVEWQAIREIEASKMNISSFDSIKKELSGLEYFALKIVNDQVPELVSYRSSDNASYQQNFNYYSGGMKNDVFLVANGDTLPCVLFHYERNYGAAPINVFSLAFENKKNADATDKELVVDASYMGLGIVKFNFNKEDIADIPKLKLN